MNQTKIKYLTKRVEDIYSNKRQEIYDQYKRPIMTVEQRHAALKEGRFTVKDIVPTRYSTNLLDFLDFEEAPEPNIEERDAKVMALTKKKQDLLDELVIGEEDTALQLLRDFAGE